MWDVRWHAIVADVAISWISTLSIPRSGQFGLHGRFIPDVSKAKQCRQQLRDDDKYDEQPIFYTCNVNGKYFWETMTSNKLYMQKETALFSFFYEKNIVREDGNAARILHPGSCILICLTGVTSASWSRSKKAYLLYFNRESIESSLPDLHDLEWWLYLSLWSQSTVHSIFLPGPASITRGSVGPCDTASALSSPVSSIVNLVGLDFLTAYSCL